MKSFLYITIALWTTCIHFSCHQNSPDVITDNIKVATVSKAKLKNTLSPKSVLMKTLDEVMGKFDPAKHEDFVLIDAKYADRNDRFMHKKAYESFQNMWNHAKNEGVELKIISATRNFDYQKGIWERKWTGNRKVNGERLNETIHNNKDRALKILEFSSMPGTSRHHWGTDIDLNSFENNYFNSGNGKVEYEWLVKNANTYGFCQPYTKKDTNRPDGYNEEKWHWSFVPIANQYFNQAKDHMNDSMIHGFLGSETAVEIAVVEKYILGINKSCK